MHTMANRALNMLRGASTVVAATSTTSTTSGGSSLFSFSLSKSTFPKALVEVKQRSSRNYTAKSSLEPPDVPRLAQTARISLTPHEVEEFAPKIQQVVDWFGQLQTVDLQSIEPAIRADTEGDNLRDDSPDTFTNREAIIAAIPSYEDPFIKVPKVLNKE